MKNKIEDLRDHLFATLEALADPDAEVDLERVKAINEVSKTLIDSARVEVAFINVTGTARTTDFIPNGERPKLIGGRA